MTTNARSRMAKAARLQGIVAGLQKRNTGQTLTFGNYQMKVEDIISAFNAYEPQVTATVTAHTAWMNQLRSERTLVARVDPMALDLENYLRGLYGTTSTALVDYGLNPRAPRKPTPTTKVGAAQKSAATRKARNTLGKRQKAAIHGTVPVPVTPTAATASGSAPTTK
jgi:hypothetical protein